MKNYLFSLLLACFAGQLLGQALPSNYIASYPQSVQAYQTYLEMHPEVREQAQASRVLSYTSFEWDALGSQWMYNDTCDYSYTGTRGGDVQGPIPLFDQRLIRNWDGAGWVDRYLYENTFDANDQVLVTTWKEWDGMGWYSKSRDTYTYDSNGNMLTATHEIRSGSSLVFDYRQLYTYYPDGSRKSYQQDVWNGLQWEGDYRSEYTYTSFGQVETELREVYTGSWENSYLLTYVFDSSSRRTERIRQNWAAGSWQYYQRELYGYNAQNRYVSYLFQTYNAGVWEDKSRETYTHNSNGDRITSLTEAYVAGTWQNQYSSQHIFNAQFQVIEDAYFEWLGGAWQKNQRYTYTYDVDGNLNSTSSYTDNMGMWEESYRTVYTFNSFGQFLTGMSKQRIGMVLVNRDSVAYHYEIYDDGTGINSFQEIESRILPNPFTVNVAIQLNVVSSDTYNFEVYNMAGQQVYKEQRYWPAGQQTLVWEGKDKYSNTVPTGAYFFRIGNDTHVTTGKLIKE